MKTRHARRIREGIAAANRYETPPALPHLLGTLQARAYERRAHQLLKRRRLSPLLKIINVLGDHEDRLARLESTKETP